MAAKTSAYATSVLNLLRGTSITATTTIYVGLLQSNGTELSGNGYARQAVTFGAPSSTGSGNEMQVANTGAVTFGPATSSDWAAASKFAVYDASSAGNKLYGDVDLAVAKTVQVGDSASYAIGALVVKEN